MFQPSGHSPDEARIEMSGYILSAGGGGRGGGGQDQVADNYTWSQRPLARHISAFLLLSPSFVFLYIAEPSLRASPTLSDITAPSSSVSTGLPEADRMSPPPGPQRNRIRCRPCKVTQLNSIRRNPKPSVCPLPVSFSLTCFWMDDTH